MISITNWLIKRFIKRNENTTDIQVRAKYGVLEAGISIIINVILFIIKLTLGIVAGSIALIADAFHTLGDVGTSGVVLFGAYSAKRPPDHDHPYGHGRAEPIATLIISILLIVTGIEFIHIAVARIKSPLVVSGSWSLIIIMIISAVVKEWMARFSAKLGCDIDSYMLKADAWHHRSDAFAAILVVLALLGVKIGYKSLDPLFALCIAGLIIVAGVKLAKTMISALIGEAPSKELIDKVFSVVGEINGIKGVHGLQIHDYGHVKYCSIHIEVSPRLITSKSHGIADMVEDVLRKKLNISTVVHVDIQKER